MDRAIHLLSLLVTILASEGYEAPSIDPWHGWRAFKHFVRVVDEIPDPGVSVQIAPQPDSSCSLFLVRQVVRPESDDWLEPVGGVVCEFSFARARDVADHRELWSFDHESFAHFVHEVELYPPFLDLVARTPRWSSVYWANFVR
jgi:hypothetical protein